MFFKYKSIITDLRRILSNSLSHTSTSSISHHFTLDDPDYTSCIFCLLCPRGSLLWFILQISLPSNLVTDMC